MRTVAIAAASLAALAAMGVLAAASPAGQGRDEAAIERLLRDHAAALSDFPRTRDVSAVLRHYAPGYTGLRDGSSHSLFRLKKGLMEIRDEARRGKSVTISYRVSNVRAQSSGNIGWATYDFSDERGLEGLPLYAASGKCTGIYRKRGSAWTILHDHCSGARPAEDSDNGGAR